MRAVLVAVAGAMLTGIVPVAAQIPFTSVTPCRVMDTRAGEGQVGSFGPPTMTAGTTRTINIPQNTRCNIPAGVSAYSLNITVVPSGPLSFLTVYPTGQSRPGVSTLNSFDGRIVANAALVPAGAGGAIDIFVTDRTDVLVDINGYFGGAAAQMRFYPVTPCRVVDTRVGEGQTGAFGPPTPTAGTRRDVPIPFNTRCNIPADSRAYSFNVTVVPPAALAFLTIWPTGQAQPVASTLNSYEGRVVANAAIVPAGTNGSVSFFVTDRSDVVIDINGYFRQQ